MHLTLIQACEYVGISSRNTFKKYNIPYIKDPLNPRRKLYDSDLIDKLVTDRDMPRLLPSNPVAPSASPVDSGSGLDMSQGQILFDELLMKYYPKKRSKSNVADVSSLTVVYLSLAAIELELAAAGGVNLDLATLHAKTLSNKNLILRGLPNV